MRCLKCGREIKDPEVFCELCQEDMSAYPVKPGTPIQLPHRAEAPKKKPPKKKKQLKPEEQIPRLRSNIRLLSLALTGLTVLLFIFSRQAYAAAFLFIFFAVKAFLLLKKQ